MTFAHPLNAGVCGPGRFHNRQRVTLYLSSQKVLPTLPLPASSNSSASSPDASTPPATPHHPKKCASTRPNPTQKSRYDSLAVMHIAMTQPDLRNTNYDKNSRIENTVEDRE